MKSNASVQTCWNRQVLFFNISYVWPGDCSSGRNLRKSTGLLRISLPQRICLSKGWKILVIWLSYFLLFSEINQWQKPSRWESRSWNISVASYGSSLIGNLVFEKSNKTLIRKKPRRIKLSLSLFFSFHQDSGETLDWWWRWSKEKFLFVKLSSQICPKKNKN